MEGEKPPLGLCSQAFAQGWVSGGTDDLLTQPHRGLLSFQIKSKQPTGLGAGEGEERPPLEGGPQAMGGATLLGGELEGLSLVVFT